MNTTADKLNYLAETKTAIKDAIVAKGVAVSDGDTFRSYATKIGEIQSGGKAVITDSDQVSFQGSTFSDFPYDKIDLTKLNIWANMFYRCPNLKKFNLIDSSNRMSVFNFAFKECQTLEKIIMPISGTYFIESFIKDTELRKIDFIDMYKISIMNYTFMDCNNLSFLLIKNLGESKMKSYPHFVHIIKWGDDANTWGDGTPVVGSRQSLIDSLITYSYDRASNGMPTATITLAPEVQARLTEEEKAQITAKGFTIA